MERWTKPGFPDDVDDRYRELMSTYRKYLYIIKIRRAGHLFELHQEFDVHPGDQAFDCVACPRPGFNFYRSEVDGDEMKWFRAYFSYDGNFRAYRKNKKVDAGDVCFSDGIAFFPPKEEYEEWIKGHPEPKKSEEKPVCDNHKAGKDNLIKLAGRDITGIGAFTCTSHSCVAPRGMVNFFKGERQIYCDFAFASMYKHLSSRGELPIGMTYDIWCHWWTNFWRRMVNLPPLYQIPEDLDITGAIPKWHLLGHQRLCWILYSLDHKQFVGRLEGEGPERVWAHFNEHSGSTSEQGPGQRQDSWCNIACDWGFVKAIEMHRTLPARFREAKKSHSEQLSDHNNLTGTFPRRKIREWESECIEPKDEKNDGNWTTPLMDPVIKGGYYETLREERENESEAVRLTGRRTGAVRWIADGIELEHSLENLKDERRTLGSNPTSRQAELLNSKRLALRDRIDHFTQKRALHMLEIGEADRPRPLQFVGEDGEWAEPIELGLPSSYEPSTLAAAGLSKLADIERKLRRGTCTDALESVKRLLGGKAAAIKFKNLHISGQVAITRAESAIQKHTAKILKARKRYLNSRQALLQLEPTEVDLDQYRDLEISDLKPLKTYFEEYAQTTGHGKTSMSWIWRSAAAPNKDDWEIDSLKTEWFRSRERFKRWDEQLVLLKREMVMSVRSFRRYEELWKWRATNGQPSLGMSAYALKRSAFFGELARRMLDACLEHLKDDIVCLKWADNWLANNVSDHPLFVKHMATIKLGSESDKKLRAICEGLEHEMFGEGGYDAFIASLTCDLAETSTNKNKEEEGGMERAPCEVRMRRSPAQLEAAKASPSRGLLKDKKREHGLIIASRGSANSAVTSTSNPARSGPPKDTVPSPQGTVSNSSNINAPDGESVTSSTPPPGFQHIHPRLDFSEPHPPNTICSSIQLPALSSHYSSPASSRSSMEVELFFDKLMRDTSDTA
ncbi:elongator complex protein 1 [Ceratobasidium sp. AG-Ba]|nr:elongator complex protein 1 [Ceratobasidium sp. AG-Ba]